MLFCFILCVKDFKFLILAYSFRKYFTHYNSFEQLNGWTYSNFHIHVKSWVILPRGDFLKGTFFHISDSH